MLSERNTIAAVTFGPDRSRADGIKVGLTERHGMADEASQVPPAGVEYEFLNTIKYHHGPIRSPIKTFLRRFDDRHVDLVEAILSPVITDRPWIYSHASFSEPMAFTLLGLPLPKFVRRRYLEELFLRDNFKKFVFWSQAGLESMKQYGAVKNEQVLEKAAVVRPAVREVPAALQARPEQRLQLLFSGDFFRKGGAHVVDAFEILQQDFPEARLRICSGEEINFDTPDRALRDEYLQKIHANESIIFGRVDRQTMLSEVLPQTSIYLLPTYDEAFGYAILEAMAYGIPVIATDVFAIPEMIEDGKTGLLIDASAFDFKSICRGYVVQQIPRDFKQQLTELLVAKILQLAEAPQRRAEIGQAAQDHVRSHFSFARRNAEMSRIYADAVA